MEILSICLTKIPTNKIRLGKDGHKYVGIVVSKRKQPDEYGNDLTVSISKSEQERKEKAATLYVGSGKTFAPAPASDTVGGLEDMPVAEELDDLPF